MGLFGSFFGGAPQSKQTIKTPTDLVSNTVNLASNPDDISTVFDQMRDITVRVAPNQQLSPSQETMLLKLYLTLEEYLITKEPIRKFTREELRSRIDPTLLARLSQLT